MSITIKIYIFSKYWTPAVTLVTISRWQQRFLKNRYSDSENRPWGNRPPENRPRKISPENLPLENRPYRKFVPGKSPPLENREVEK